MGALGTLLGSAHPPHRAPPTPLPLLLHLLLLRRHPAASAAAQEGAARGASLPQDREQSLFHGRDAGTALRRGAEAGEVPRLALPERGRCRTGSGLPRYRGNGEPPTPADRCRRSLPRGEEGAARTPRAEVAEPGGKGEPQLWGLGLCFPCGRVTASLTVASWGL